MSGWEVMGSMLEWRATLDREADRRAHARTHTHTHTHIHQLQPGDRLGRERATGPFEVVASLRAPPHC